MINCIVAIEKSQGIGFRGHMPWPRLPDDMKWFQKQTSGNIIIMGRKTWESIGSKNLPNRINVVISRNSIQGSHASFSSPNDAISYCKEKFSDKGIFIIGGSAIYEEYLDLIETFYITEIDQNYNCDKFFPFDFVKNNFKKIINHGTFTDPINYTIKEYRYETPRI